MSKKLAEIISTIFYIGYFPIASGTLGSAIGVIIYYLVKDNYAVYLLTAVLLFVIGFFSSHIYEGFSQKKDPHEVIIDETASVFIAYLFIPFSFKTLIIGFLLYRLFDIIKPPPARKLENLPGGFGIMLDDLIAGLYTNIILRIFILLGI